MKPINRFSQFGICLLLAMMLLVPALVFGQQQSAIESGQYFSGSVYFSETNSSFTPVDYMFFAKPTETVIVRVANESGIFDSAPQCFIHGPPDGQGALLGSSTDALFVNEVQLTNLTDYGWYRIRVTQTNTLYDASHNFSVSFLRLPDAPLSYPDLDVGTIRSGETLEGAIDVGADLDAATFLVSTQSTVQIRMGQKDVLLVPVIQLFDPSGQMVTNPFPVEYRAEFTVSLTSTGIYTLVCNDKFNASGPYALSMVQIPGVHTNSTDLDLGTIISGETLTGTIDKPGDLDVAIFTVVTGDVVRLTMDEVDAAVNPVMELYDPSGRLVKRATDVLQVTVTITNTTTTDGTYTVICKDAEDRYGVRYTLTFELLGGPSMSNMPTAPTGVSATDGTYEDHVAVTWNLVSEANGYDVWRSYSTNIAVQLSTNTSSASYDDYDVTSGTIYYYKVKSRNDYGTSTNFSDTDSGYSGTAVISSERRALLVGISEYAPSYGASDLNAPVADATGIRDTVLLGDPSNRWSETNITFLTDVQATKASIRGALTTLAGISEAGDLVLYYHSGHGGQTDPGVNPSNTYISAYDADYTDTELGSDLTAFMSEVTVIIVIDTCNSAGMFKFRGTGIEYEWPFAKRVMAEYRGLKEAEFRSKGLAVPRDLGNNIAFMTSSDYDELSWETSTHGIYTGYLLQGCTLSSVDTNSDGEYQFLELHDYAAVEAAAAATESQQNAQTYNDTLLGNTVARAAGAIGVALAAGLDNDYDGDGVSDLAVYHEDTGQWYIWSLANGLIAWGFAWGGPGFSPLTGDYDADGVADLAVYHEDTGQWYIWSLRKGLIAWAVAWGGPGLTPVAGDYSGDGVSDLGLYDKNTGYWYAITLSGAVVVLGKSWTGTGFTAVPGDYNGDGLSDYAMYHDAMGYWYVVSPAGKAIIWGALWGGTGYTPVPGDYDGDSVFDLAVYYDYTGQWFIWSQARSAMIADGTYWGGSGFIPVPGDFDGDGSWDTAVYHQDTGYWFIQSADGSQSIAFGVVFGGSGFVPVLSTTW